MPFDILDDTLIRANPHLSGSKAFNLMDVARLGLNVPRGFVVAATISDERIQETAFQNRLNDALQKIAPVSGLFAVRSSAQCEDSFVASWAGQFDSFLKVSKCEVIEHLHKVRQSADSSRIKIYQQQRNLDNASVPAVLIQEMIDADVSGVAFGMNPFSGAWREYIITAVQGSAEDLVGGRLDGESWQWNYPYAMGEALTTANSLLTTQQQLQVVDALRKLNRFFCYPQDIEFAFTGDVLWILQSRPITLGSAVSGWGQSFSLVDNSNIGESYHGVTTPFTYSFARHVYSGVYEQFCSLMGVSDRVVRRHKKVFQNMVSCVRGRIYYNLLNWYRVLAMLPGYKWNKSFMEQMMGVEQSLAAHLTAEVATTTKLESALDFFGLVRSVTLLFWQYLTLEAKIAKFQTHVETTLQVTDITFEEMSPVELITCLDQLDSQLIACWDAPLVNDFFTMIYFGLLRRCSDRLGIGCNALLVGQGRMVSAEPVLWMRKIAEGVENKRESSLILTTGTLREIEELLIAQPPLRQEAHAFFEKFGDRCLDELKLESSTYLDDPLPFWRTIGALCNAVPRTVPEVASLGQGPLTKQSFYFKYLLRNTKRLIRNRENLRFERTRVFGRVRRIVLQLGKRLVAMGLLQIERDVFYLELEELRGIFRNTISCWDLKGIVEVRKRQYASWQKDEDLPRRIETFSPVHCRESWQVQLPVGDGSGESFFANPCSPGVVEAEVCVITDPRDHCFKQGQILIAERTDPGWIVLFALAGGIVVENGSLLSHTAIVARELGIPTIIGLKGATKTFRSGMVVRLNGQTGEIVILENVNEFEGARLAV